MNINQLLFLKYFQKKQRKQSNNFINFDKVKKILLLGDMKCFENRELNEIVSRYEAVGKQVKTLIYTDRAYFPKEISQKVWNKNLFSKREVNLFGRPKAKILNDIAVQDFDLLVDLSVVPSLPAMYVIAAVNATCKIGLKELDVPLYNLIIDVNSSKNSGNDLKLITVFEKIDYYLKKIN
ncbi:MAG: hypothetical protein LBS01_06780 [Prevotellaceae bacterium]|jgi:hypothetical protein|nr:hypothetical protein [Prevotellaceae bacterium]